MKSLRDYIVESSKIDVPIILIFKMLDYLYQYNETEDPNDLIDHAERIAKWNHIKFPGYSIMRNIADVFINSKAGFDKADKYVRGREFTDDIKGILRRGNCIAVNDGEFSGYYMYINNPANVNLKDVFTKCNFTKPGEIVYNI